MVALVQVNLRLPSWHRGLAWMEGSSLCATAEQGWVGGSAMPSTAIHPPRPRLEASPAAARCGAFTFRPRPTRCRIIAENFLEGWWRDLDATLTTDKHVDTQRIHKIMA